MTSEKIIDAGYNYNAPALAAEMLAAVSADPLQLTLGTHAPAINTLGSSTTLFSEGTGSGINLNLPSPGNETDIIPDNASPNLKTVKPYERPLSGQLVGRKDPLFALVILESSEVAKAAADEHHAEFFSQQGARGGYKKKMREPVHHEADAAPAKRKRRYKWPAKRVAKLDARIEQLRNEALLDPAHGRPLTLIQEKIDELQAQKSLVHARMLDLMYGEGEGSSDEQAPPSTGN
ncbi:hypothetical protein BAE44_0005456 [Dichanthelium oligosanthes]|uniref:Uncharacterized protein n=1 Tax=Dichanthelium oligosanthes TaxID=888268 RepID=A0A1E5W847_9POAL|nr:hypothetical protein BAE44_0005456 [Dichanthelium oligosanthes]